MQQKVNECYDVNKDSLLQYSVFPQALTVIRVGDTDFMSREKRSTTASNKIPNVGASPSSLMKLFQSTNLETTLLLRSTCKLSGIRPLLQEQQHTREKNIRGRRLHPYSSQQFILRCPGKTVVAVETETESPRNTHTFAVASE